MTDIIYLTRNGLLEPLGQSQVMAYVRGLSRDYSFTIISFEREEDWADLDTVELVRQDCDRHGIRWLPHNYRSRPWIIAPALNMMRMAWLLWSEVRGGRGKLVHARSYVPSAVALIVHRFTGVPFIFDMRALWPEELITAGRLTRGAILHRAIVAAERMCLRDAASVVSLTRAAVVHLTREYPVELRAQKIVVIPTCADLDRFCPAPVKQTGNFVHGCIGTILSGWFRTDWLAAWLSAVAINDPDAQFDVVTRDDVNHVREVLDPNGALSDRLSVEPRRSEEMPAAVRGHDLSVMFYAGGEVSELGRSPTRMAEVLGCWPPCRGQCRGRRPLRTSSVRTGSASSLTAPTLRR